MHDVAMLSPGRAPSDHRAYAPATDDFVREVRIFLQENLTAELRTAGQQTTGFHSEIGACRMWHERLYRKGWIAPAWPTEFGGTGWTHEQRFLFEQECARNDAPVLFATGLRSIGPLIIAMGTAEQKQRYLPPILWGADLWCQGFSESEAGSDLAAIQTRAIRDGDGYVVSGRKLWTTGAHLANRMFALVRTEKGSKPQEGITFLLLNMETPGIRITPIITIDGQHEFNEVNFDEVRVPAADRIGAENDGWAVAKHLMRLARSNNTTSGSLHRGWRQLERMLATQHNNIESGLRYRIAQLQIDLVCLESLELRLLKSGRLSGEDEAGSSLMKLSATELHQKITELMIDIAGPCGLAVNPPDDRSFSPANCSYAGRKYFATRAATIYSGTNEIHRNLIARHLGKIAF
jgi:acyl-CoA dehydrogenase